MATRVDEIAALHLPDQHARRQLPGGLGFGFNQYLIVDDEPLLFHYRERQCFRPCATPSRRVMPVERLRWVALSHLEADECGSPLNECLAAAPQAVPLCGRRRRHGLGRATRPGAPPRALGDGEELALGTHAVRWYDTPQRTAWLGMRVPLPKTSTRTLLCGDLFTQAGHSEKALTEADILGPSEAFRHQMDYFAPRAADGCDCWLDSRSRTPRTLACMHGCAWRGDGAALLRALAAALD